MVPPSLHDCTRTRPTAGLYMAPIPAESLSYCRRMGAPVVRAWPLMLLRGTPLADRKFQLGLVESCDLGLVIADKASISWPHFDSCPAGTLRCFR